MLFMSVESLDIILLKPVVIVRDSVGRGTTCLKQTCVLVQFVYLYQWFHVCPFFHCSIFHSLLDYNLELRSSSLTLGNASELSFLSLNRDLLTIIDIDTLSAGLLVEFHASQRVPSVE